MHQKELLFVFFYFLFIYCKNNIGFSEPTFIYDGYPLNVPEENTKLYVSIIPYKNFIELSHDYTSLFEYLSKKINKKISYLPVDEYYKIYFLLETKKIQIAMIDPYFFLKKKLDKTYKIIIKPIYKDIPYNSSLIVARNDNPIKILDTNLIEKYSISLDNLESFFGYILLMKYLENSNSNINKFNKIFLSSNFENTVQSVLSGNTDIGCIDLITYNKYKNKGIGLKVIYQSESYEHFPIVIDSQLDSDLQKALIQAFLEINIKNQKELLLKIDENLIGFTSTDINEYKNYLE